MNKHTYIWRSISSLCVATSQVFFNKFLIFEGKTCDDCQMITRVATAGQTKVWERIARRYTEQARGIQQIPAIENR